MAPPTALFQGYDSVNLRGLSTALEGETQFPRAARPLGFVKCAICTSSSELIDALRIDQPTIVAFAGGCCSSEKLRFIHSLNLTSFSICILIYARHVHGTEVVTNVRLRDGVNMSGVNGTLFFALCYGDSYVSSHTTGGEYYAVYAYHCNSRKHQRQLAAEMEGAGLYNGMPVDDSLQTKLGKFNASHNAILKFYHCMSGIENPQYPSSGKIVKFALQFCGMELTAPLIIELTGTGYEHVPIIGTAFDAVKFNRDLLTCREASVALNKLRELREEMAAINKLYEFYGGYDNDTKLQERLSQADRDVKAVREMVLGYGLVPTRRLATGPQNLQSVASGYEGNPVLVYEVKTFGNATGPGGSQFNDVVDAEDHLQQQRWISGIKVCTSSNAVNCIIVTYSGRNGSMTYKHGSSENARHTHGLQLGPHHSMSLDVVGDYGVVPYENNNKKALAVKWLSVRAAGVGEISGGDHSTAGKDKFEWRAKIRSGEFLLGLKGRKGSLVDALQLVYASFRPAEWCPPMSPWETF